VGIFGETRCRPDRVRTDAELLTAHVDGDPYAFEELFRRHHRQLYRLAHLTSRDPDDAADALQDAMFAAHRKARSFRHDSAVSSWLYRIVVNASLDRLRRNKSRACEALDEQVLCASDPTGRVDTSIVVQRALLRLPVEQRAAVVAVDMQGYSVAEAARLLGVAEGTVKSRCSRARTKLAESLTCFAADSSDLSDSLEPSGTDMIGGSDDEQRREPPSGSNTRICRPHPGRRTRRGPSRAVPPGR
jgi:RNA polymerase sigma-70 factor, ECF subfamily